MTLVYTFVNNSSLSNEFCGWFHSSYFCIISFNYTIYLFYLYSYYSVYYIYSYRVLIR